SGDIDVAIVYGPVAGYFAAQHPGEWNVVPVSPEFVSELQLFRIWTIGVRPGDESLRDSLNVALAERWDEIQALLDEYNVPLASVPRPVVTRDSHDLDSPDGDKRIRIGVVLPIPTGNPAATDVVGEAARRGAGMAEGALADQVVDAGRTLEVLFASS